MASQIVYLSNRLLCRIADRRDLERKLGLQNMHVLVEADPSRPLTLRIVADAQIHCREAWPALLGDAFVLMLTAPASDTPFRPLLLSEATAVGVLEVVRQVLLELDGLSGHDKMAISRGFDVAATASRSVAATSANTARPPTSTVAGALDIQSRFAARLSSLDSKLARYQAIVASRGLDYLVARLACHAEFGQLLHLRPHPHYREFSETYLLAEPNRGSFIKQQLASENLANAFHDVVMRAGPHTAVDPVPIDTAFVDALHSNLMRTVGLQHRSGWRTDRMWLHDPATGEISDGGVEPGELDGAMGTFAEEYLAGGWDDVHPIIQAGLMHLEFARIHPFRDGNGRTARMLLQLILMRRGLPMLPLELAFVRERPLYLAAIKGAITTGDPMPFLEFLMEACERSIASGYRMAAALRRERYAIVEALVGADIEAWRTQPLAEWILVHVLTDGAPPPYENRPALPSRLSISNVDVTYNLGPCWSSPVVRGLLQATR
jgi:hypothetical protein